MKKYVLFLILLSLALKSTAQSSSYSPALGYEDHKNTFGLNHTDGTIRLGTYALTTATYFQTHSNHPLYFGTNNSSTPKVVLAAPGYLGINLADGVLPAEKLEIKNGSIALYGWENASKPTGIEFTNNAGTLSRAFVGVIDAQTFGFRSYTTGLNEIVFKTISGNVRVGLGNPNPIYTLDINGSIRLNALAGSDRGLAMVKTDGTLRRFNEQPTISVAPTDYTFSDLGMLNDSDVGYDASPSFGNWLPFGTYHFVEKSLQLLQGSTIKNFTANFIDNNGSGKMQACLRIINNTTGATNVYCVNSANDNANAQPYTMSSDIAEVVNNDTYSYVLRVESVTNALANGPWNASMGICGVKFKIGY